MPTQLLKTQYVFAPITRVDEKERIVEGYCFCNETVDGEDGIRIKRTAMEAATADYLKWGAVRSMHGPLAAGTALGIEWDERGAKLTAKIVDDQEWRKVQERVYKGFSIGVRPTLMRGKDVDVLNWVENSLVDRPKDPDSVFTTYRAEGFDPDAEFECEVEEIERAASEQDGVQDAPADQLGTDPVKAGDCTITREGALYVLNGPDGALIGKFATEAEARQRAAEVEAAMAKGEPSDEKGTTLILPTDRAEPAPLQDGEQVSVTRDGDSGKWQLRRAGEEALIHEAETVEELGAWIKANTPAAVTPEPAPTPEPTERAITSETPDLPKRENLEGKCPVCGADCTRCMGTQRSDEPAPEPISTDTPDETRSEEALLLRLAKLDVDNAELVTRAESAEAELARVQTVTEDLNRNLTAAKERISRLEATPAPNQPLRFAHAVNREFFANARTTHDDETALIEARMEEIRQLAPTSDLGEQSKRAEEYQRLKMALASRQ